tara:strand:+ start:157 stop:762 length:606 start_codon:yes stop_codon:yes gene_type:complete
MIKKTIVAFTLYLFTISCDKTEIVPTPSIKDFSYDFQNEEIIKSDLGNNAYCALAEVLSSLERSPEVRTLKKIDYKGSQIMDIQGHSDDESFYFCISNNAIYTLYSSFKSMSIKKNELNGTLISTKIVWENSSNSTFTTYDRSRLALKNNLLYLVIRAKDYSTQLFSLNINTHETNWPELIEPSQPIFGLSMTGVGIQPNQ